mgnify:CR=1 FL=1
MGFYSFEYDYDYPSYNDIEYDRQQIAEEGDKFM